MGNMKILAFGEVLWDFIEGEKHFGGAPVNFAAHLVQCGGVAAMVTAIGNDKLGDQARTEMLNRGVSDALVQVNEQLTGRVMVFLTNGQPTYRIRKEVAYDYVDKEQLDLNKMKSFDAFYFGTLAQRNTVSREALRYILDHIQFGTVFYDVNLRKDAYSKEVIAESLQSCTVVKMNDDEVEMLSPMLYGMELSTEHFVGRLQVDFPHLEIILVTAGAKGCTVYTRDMKHEVAAEAIQVKDTVGAGDAFCAAFLTTYLKTGDARKAARIGNKVGGFVASQHGAIPEYPERFRRKVEILCTS